VNVGLHCIVCNLKSISKLSTLHLLKISVESHVNRSWSISTITGLRTTAQRSFSKLMLLNTFHRSTMIAEKLANLSVIYFDSEAAKTLDITELTETFAFWKLVTSHFPSLKQQILTSVCFTRCFDCVVQKMLIKAFVNHTVGFYNENLCQSKR